MALKQEIVFDIIKEVSDKASVTERDIHDYWEAFYEYDKDESGNISTCELGQVMRSLGENPTSMEIEALINEFDDDENGTIEFPEFVILMARKAQEGGYRQEKMYAMEAFRALTSANSLKRKKIQDRILPVTELRVVMDNLISLGITTNSSVNELLQDMDKNQDGLITFSEFEAYMSSKV